MKAASDIDLTSSETDISPMTQPIGQHRVIPSMDDIQGGVICCKFRHFVRSTNTRNKVVLTEIHGRTLEVLEVSQTTVFVNTLNNQCRLPR